MICKNATINGHRTSLRLEQVIWDTVDDICLREGLTVHQLFTWIDNHRYGDSRTSAVRSFVVDYLRVLAPMNGDQQQGIALSILSKKISDPHAAYS